VVKKLKKLIEKSLFFILFVLISSLLFGQKDPTLKLIVSVKRNTVGQPTIPYSDSLKIEFDLGFTNDSILIKTNNGTFTTKSLKTDLLFGHAGTIKIPKANHKQRLTIYFNNTFVGQLILKKRFSAVHIDKVNREFRWTYINYHFFYL